MKHTRKNPPRRDRLTTWGGYDFVNKPALKERNRQAHRRYKAEVLTAWRQGREDRAERVSAVLVRCDRWRFD